MSLNLRRALPITVDMTLDLASSTPVTAKPERGTRAGLRQTVEVVSAGARQTEIRESIEQVLSVAEQSSASAEEVSATTEQTSASAQQIAASAGELAHTAESLRGVVSQFKLV